MTEPVMTGPAMTGPVMTAAGAGPAAVSGFLRRAREVEVPIRLARAEVFMLSVPMVRALRSAYGTSPPVKRMIIVRLEDHDGTPGWGEAPVADRPLYGSDTAESTWFALAGLLLPPLIGPSFGGPADAARTWEPLIGQHYAKNAAESALWAIASAKLGIPLAGLWGGVREAIPVGESFPICDDIDQLLAHVSARVGEGFGRIKLKIAPGWDVGPATAVQEAFPALPLSVDANCGYRLDSGPWGELDRLGLAMIEQPLAGDALIELAELQASLRTPLCLDETVSTHNVTRTALRMQAGRIVNIKPPRLGGPLASIAVHDLCAAAQVPVWCGGMLESGIGRAFNLSLAALPGFTMHSDMSPARLLYVQDLVEPTFDIRSDGFIAVPTRPGNGFPVVPERVADCAIRRWSSDPRA